MKPTQKELTAWAINQIEKHYHEDVALLIAISGHALEDDCHGECFDYFIPATNKGYNLSKTFILDGVGHDLYPRSWERIEDMAEFRDDFTFGLANGEILYARSEDDRNKFLVLQQRLNDNLHDKPFMYKKALEKLDTAMEIYRTMMFEPQLYKVRMAAGFIAFYLAVAVACLNGSYFQQRLDLETVELAKMKALPENFIAYYEAIVHAKAGEELKHLSHLIISSARRFIAAQNPTTSERTPTPDYQGLAGWYEEVSLTWRRIDYHCDTGNYERVFPDAIRLQNELNIIKEEFSLQEMDLLGCFDTNNLTVFKQRALELEQYIVTVINQHGIALNKYATLEQFLMKNS